MNAGQPAEERPASAATDEPPNRNDVERLERLTAVRRTLEKQIGRRIIGQSEIVEKLLITLLADGHALLVGVPGLAKTLLVSTLAEALDLQFSRIQFTPDLMPSDITGTELLEEDAQTGRRTFRFMPGPIFANVILADEINRTPPKTQAALLQAMQEGEVTVAGDTFELERPFFVLATQNPIEQEGTYPLPEAQLDRFMFELRISYPTHQEEMQVATHTATDEHAAITPVLSARELAEYQSLVRRVPAPPSLVEYAVRLTRATRPTEPEAPDFIRRMVSWGAGPRASQHTVMAAKGRAALQGRPVPNLDDLRAVAADVLRHRLVPSFEAEADGQTADDLITQLLTLDLGS